MTLSVAMLWEMYTLAWVSLVRNALPSGSWYAGKQQELQLLVFALLVTSVAVSKKL